MNTLPIPADCDCDAPCGPGCSSVGITDITQLVTDTVDQVLDAEIVAAIAANQNMQTVDTAAALRASTNHQNTWAAWINGLLVSGDGQGGFYDYDSASVLVDDGINVLQPNDVGGGAPGRWIKRL